MLQRFQGGRPIQGPGGFEQLRQTAQRTGQLGVLSPAGDQLQHRRQRADERLGGRHAELGAGAQRQGKLRQGGERRTLVIDQGDDQSAGVPGGVGRGQEVRALARLGDHQAQRPLHGGGGVIDRADRRRRRGGHDPQPGLDQIAGESGRIVGAAAAIGEHRAGRGAPQPRGQALHQGRIGGELGADRPRRFGRLEEHAGAAALRSTLTLTPAQLHLQLTRHCRTLPPRGGGALEDHLAHDLHHAPPVPSSATKS